MEMRSYESYIDELISTFEYSNYAPENASNISATFKSKFYIDGPYWKLGRINPSGGIFQVEFKKYGENRRQIFMQFSFELESVLVPREVVLTLIDSESKILNEMEEIIKFSDIWKDHSILAEHLKKYVKEGLKLAEKPYI